jgi:hypothetical protein
VEGTAESNARKALFGLEQVLGRGFRPCMGVELFEYVLDVCLRGARADEKQFSDLSIRQALAD